MMYNVSGGGKTFRKYNSVNLAWWHTFKMAAMKIWKVFAPDVFAPLFHHLFPGHTFFVKPSSFVCVQAHLVWLFMSREAAIPKLTELTEDHTQPPRVASYARDVLFLLKIAIPVVRNPKFEDPNY